MEAIHGKSPKDGVEVEHDGLVVGSLDRTSSSLPCERAFVVVAAFEQRLVVAQPAGEFGGEGAFEAVLDVGRGDRRTVFVLQPVLELERPGLAVVAGLACVGGQVGHDLGLLAGLDVPGGQAAVHVRQRGDRQALALAGVEVDVRGVGEDVECSALVGLAESVRLPAVLVQFGVRIAAGEDESQ
jgi:hypothetical protein